MNKELIITNNRLKKMADRAEKLGDDEMSQKRHEQAAHWYGITQILLSGIVGGDGE